MLFRASAGASIGSKGFTVLHTSYIPRQTRHFPARNSVRAVAHMDNDIIWYQHVGVRVPNHTEILNLRAELGYPVPALLDLRLDYLQPSLYVEVQAVSPALDGAQAHDTRWQERSFIIKLTMHCCRNEKQQVLTEPRSLTAVHPAQTRV